MAVRSCRTICDCNLSLGNTGGDCSLMIEVAKKLLLQPYFDSTGVQNYIDLTATLNAAYFTAMLTNVDVTKRLFPLPGMKNVSDKREDSIVETFTDGTSDFVRDGARKFEGLITKKDTSTALKRAIDSGRCGEVGMYIVDRAGNIWGNLSSDGTKLYPFHLDSNSINGMLLQPSDTTNQGIKFGVIFHPDEVDSCIGGIAYSELGGANPLLFAGLKDVVPVYSGLSTTTITIALNTLFGTPKNPKRVYGRVAADFISSVGGATSKVRNLTTGADVSITGCTEGTGDNAGKYAITFTAQTSADVIQFKLATAGFDFTQVVSNTVAIP